MKTLRKLVVLWLCFWVGVGQALPASASDDPDPHRIFRFDSLPVVDYYSRSFTLSGLKPVKDLNDRDSDAIINTCPQSPKGFLAGWLQGGQAVAAVTEYTVVTMIDCSGGQVRTPLRPGEAVVYDVATHDILAVVRCANKVVEGRIKLPEPEKVYVPSPPPPPEKEIVKVPVNPCEDPGWQGWTNGRIGAYAFKHTKAKKVRVAELLDSRWDGNRKMDKGNFRFWTELATQTINGRQLQGYITQYFRGQYPDLYNKKVQLLVLNYDRCTDTLTIDWYVEGWHWREFIVGFIAGFATGFWISRIRWEPTKEPFFNPGQIGRPMTISQPTGWIVVRP